MQSFRARLFLLAVSCALLSVVVLPRLCLAKDKPPAVSPDDLTLRLFQLLDSSYGGKLADYYVIGDVYKDPKLPDKQLQHVFKVEYEKDRAFGRLRLYVRSVDALSPGQLKDYTPKQVYEFAELDVEKFTKTDPGPLGRTGDMYLQATENGPLASAPITDEVRKEYEACISQWVLPALQKK